MAKILVIDDDATFSELLSSALKREGYEVIVANEGMQGTKLAHKERPDVILLDLIMPLGGGVAALRNLKISTHTKDIPIIVISGTNDILLIDQVKNMDISAYMTKPFEMRDLIYKIKELLLL